MVGPSTCSWVAVHSCSVERENTAPLPHSSSTLLRHPSRTCFMTPIVSAIVQQAVCTVHTFIGAIVQQAVCTLHTFLRCYSTASVCTVHTFIGAIVQQAVCTLHIFLMCYSTASCVYSTYIHRYMYIHMYACMYIYMCLCVGVQHVSVHPSP